MEIFTKFPPHLKLDEPLLPQSELNNLAVSSHEKLLRKAQSNKNPSHQALLFGHPLPFSKPLPRSKYEITSPLPDEITIQDLKYSTNDDHVFIGEIYLQPYRITEFASAIVFVLKDKNEDLIKVIFYNIMKDNWHELETLFPIGRKIIIMHPRVTLDPSKLPLIYIEDRHEFHFVDEFPQKVEKSKFLSLLEESRKFKDEGNQLIERNFATAYKKYCQSAKVFLQNLPKFTNERENFLLDWKYTLSDSQKKETLEHLSIIFSNCSYGYLAEHRPLMTLYYSKMGVWCNPNYLKAKIRMAQALIDLLYLPEAEQVLLELKDNYELKELNKTVSDLQKTLSKALKEYSSPNTTVNFFRKSFDLINQQTYIGPIELFTTMEKGRGFRARRDISAGEILLIEKGFTGPKQRSMFLDKFFSYIDDKEDIKTLYMNLFSAYRNPDMSPLDKENLEPPNDSATTVSDRKFKNISMKEISEVIIGLDHYIIDTENKDNLLGIFPFLCLINHSCHPNTYHYMIDNVVLLKACRSIKKGEEIYLSYVGIVWNKVQRQENLLKYRFKCNCERCLGIGEWKVREAKFTGLLCPECAPEVPCGDDKKFSCPNKCWEEDFEYYQKLETEILMKMEEIKKIPRELYAQYIPILEADLKTYEKKVPEYSPMRVKIIETIAFFYAQMKKEGGFKKYFWEIIRCVEAVNDPFFKEAIDKMLIYIRVCFGRLIKDEELVPLKHYGLTLDEARKLWNESTVDEVIMLLDVL